MTTRRNQANTELSAIVKQMQEILDKLGIQLQVCWVPKDCDKHGELCANELMIYDRIESDMWKTFQHEMLEFALKDITRGYRLVINSLIEAIEKLTYARKEEFLEFNVKVLDMLKSNEVKS